MAFLEILLFVISLIILYESSRHVLNSAIKISQLLGMTEMAVGFILIATATSVPDLMVSVSGALMGKPAISVGDALGSTIANICLVFGIAALLRNVTIKREQTLESAELLLFITLAPLLFILTGGLTYREGVVLLFMYLLYVIFILRGKFTIRANAPVFKSKEEFSRQLTFFTASFIVVFASSHFVVQYGVEIAKMAGVSDAVIGMTLIAFATTLPELAVDFRAIRSGHMALAVGDIFGSCVINLTLVLGAAAVISPITNGFLGIFVTPIVFLLALSSFIWYVLMKHEAIKKEHGLILIVLYLIWVIFETTLCIGNFCFSYAP